ncbi:MAG: hypothetical protein ACLQU3_18580 [Limisphaerales bacterium]
MNTLHIFFSQFWPYFVVAIIVLPLVQWGRHASLDGNAAVFIGPRSFRELSSFSKEEQKRLLHEADREAFPGWRFFLPTLTYAIIFSGGAAIATTLPKVTTLACSFWVSVGFAILFVGLGSWLAGRLETRSIKRYLKIHIERTHHAA